MKNAEQTLVLGVGSPILDLLVHVDEDFICGIPGSKGGMELVDARALSQILRKAGAEVVKAPGGSSANTVFGLAQLGVKTSFMGKLGNDEAGRYYEQVYKVMGGDCSRFKVNRMMSTGRCLSLVTPDSERTMRTDLGAAATLLPSDISPEDFRDAGHLHVEGYLLFSRKLVERILELAKENGLTVSLDLASFEVVDSTLDILPELLDKYVDIVFANEEEARAFSGEDDPEKALDKLSGHCGIAAVKLGEDGSLISGDGNVVRVPARKVKAVDTTGAGDLWGAGFIYGWLNAAPLEKCGHCGSVLGAAVVQVMGAAIPAESWPGIRKELVESVN